MKKIAIFGAGGFGREVKWLIDEINAGSPQWDFAGYYDDDFSHVKLIDKSLFMGGTVELNEVREPIGIVFAIGNPLIKRKIAANIHNPQVSHPTLVHPNVRMDKGSVSIGEGTIICAGNILTVDISIGNHVILNLGCTVGHDSFIGSYCSFMPSVNISGEVKIGEAVYVGTGAKIINQLEIGEETIVGAGAVVAKTLPPRCTAVGIPAKPVKYHE